MPGEVNGKREELVLKTTVENSTSEEEKNEGPEQESNAQEEDASLTYDSLLKTFFEKAILFATELQSSTSLPHKEVRRFRRIVSTTQQHFRDDAAPFCGAFSAHSKDKPNFAVVQLSELYFLMRGPQLQDNFLVEQYQKEGIEKTLRFLKEGLGVDMAEFEQEEETENQENEEVEELEQKKQEVADLVNELEQVAPLDIKKRFDFKRLLATLLAIFLFISKLWVRIKEQLQAAVTKMNTQKMIREERKTQEQMEKGKGERTVAYENNFWTQLRKTTLWQKAGTAPQQGGDGTTKPPVLEAAFEWDGGVVGQRTHGFYIEVDRHQTYDPLQDTFHKTEFVGELRPFYSLTRDNLNQATDSVSLQLTTLPVPVSLEDNTRYFPLPGLEATTHKETATAYAAWWTDASASKAPAALLYDEMGRLFVDCAPLLQLPSQEKKRHLVVEYGISTSQKTITRTGLSHVKDKVAQSNPEYQEAQMLPSRGNLPTGAEAVRAMEWPARKEEFELLLEQVQDVFNKATSIPKRKRRRSDLSPTMRAARFASAEIKKMIFYPKGYSAEQQEIQAVDGSELRKSLVSGIGNCFDSNKMLFILLTKAGFRVELCTGFHQVEGSEKMDQKDIDTVLKEAPTGTEMTYQDLLNLVHKRQAPEGPKMRQASEFHAFNRIYDEDEEAWYVEDATSSDYKPLDPAMRTSFEEERQKEVAALEQQNGLQPLDVLVQYEREQQEILARYVNPYLTAGPNFSVSSPFFSGSINEVKRRLPKDLTLFYPQFYTQPDGTKRNLYNSPSQHLFENEGLDSTLGLITYGDVHFMYYHFEPHDSGQDEAQKKKQQQKFFVVRRHFLESALPLRVETARLLAAFCDDAYRAVLPHVEAYIERVESTKGEKGITRLTKELIDLDAEMGVLSFARISDLDTDNPNKTVEGRLATLLMSTFCPLEKARKVLFYSSGAWFTRKRTKDPFTTELGDIISTKEIHQTIQTALQNAELLTPIRAAAQALAQAPILGQVSILDFLFSISLDESREKLKKIARTEKEIQETRQRQKLALIQFVTEGGVGVIDNKGYSANLRLPLPTSRTETVDVEGWSISNFLKNSYTRLSKPSARNTRKGKATKIPH